MKYFLVLLLLAGTHVAMGQMLTHSSAISAMPPAFVSNNVLAHQQTFQEKLPGERMRNTGRTLAILGAGLFVGGIAVYSSADSHTYNKTYTNHGTYEEGDPKAALGILMITTGVGGLIPGIIFWSKGSKKLKQARSERYNAALHMGTNGLSIRLNL